MRLVVGQSLSDSVLVQKLSLRKRNLIFQVLGNLNLSSPERLSEQIFGVVWHRRTAKPDEHSSSLFQNPLQFRSTKILELNTRAESNSYRIISHNTVF